MKKSHYDRMALLDRLEKKYVRKLKLHQLQKQQKSLKQTLRTLSAKSLEKDDFQEQTTDTLLLLETE